MNRLRLVARDLLSRLTTVPELRRRKVALAACEYTVARTGLRDPVIEQALEALRHADPAGVPPLGDIESVREKLDQQYASLYERYGDADPGKWHGTFCKMIAAECVFYACHDDSLIASSESAFDALAIEKNLDGPQATGVRKLLESVLNAHADQRTS